MIPGVFSVPSMGALQRFSRNFERFSTRLPMRYIYIGTSFIMLLLRLNSVNLTLFRLFTLHPHREHILSIRARPITGVIVRCLYAIGVVHRSTPPYTILP